MYLTLTPLLIQAVKVDMSTIELTADDLYDKDKVDLEQVSLDDVWTLLQCVSTSLCSATACTRRNRLDDRIRR